MKKLLESTVSLALLTILIASCGPQDVSGKLAILAADQESENGLDNYNPDEQENSESDEDDGEAMVCPLPRKNEQEFVLDTNRNDDVPFVDNDREIKDISTDIVVKDFFKSKELLYNFLKLVYNTVNDKIIQYRNDHELEERAIFLMFKGGNVLRMIANNFLHKIDPEARNLLDEKYSQFFKRSDSDFSILIDDERLNDLDYDQVLNDMIQLAHEGLIDTRQAFLEHPENFFDFLQLKNSVAGKILQKYFDTLDETKSVNDVDNPNWFGAQFYQLQFLDDRATEQMDCRYAGQQDYLYEEEDKDGEQEIVAKPISKDNSWIMISINKTLGWSLINDPNKVVRFDLVRSKVQFEYTFKKDGEVRRRPIGGELIDISIPHENSFGLRELLDHYNEYITKFTIRLDRDDEGFNIVSENIEGLAEDLLNILLNDNERIWKASKYEKRVNRLFLLSIIEMTRSWGIGSHRTKEYVEAIKDTMLSSIEQLFPIDDEISEELADDIIESANDIASRWPDMTIANDFFVALANHIKNEMLKNPREDDEELVKEFLQVIRDNIDNMSNLSDMERSMPDLDSLYNIDMSKLI